MKLLPSAADQSLREKTESPVRNPTPSLQIHIKEIYLILFLCGWCLLESADTVVLRVDVLKSHGRMGNVLMDPVFPIEGRLPNILSIFLKTADIKKNNRRGWGDNVTSILSSTSV